MKTIIKKEENVYLDHETENEISETEILDFIKNETEFKIVNADDQDITDSELAQILIRSTKKKSESEKFFDSLKNLFETGKTTASQAMQDIFYAGYGAVITTEKKAREWIDQLVASGKVSKEKGEEMYKKAKESFQEREKQVEKKAKDVFQKKMSDMGISSTEDLENKIQDAVKTATSKIEKELKELRQKVNKM